MITYSDITETIRDIAEKWGEAGERVIECAFAEHKKISMKEFLSHCTACGGDWGGMFLTGMRELYPRTYEAIPEEMGVFAFGLISNTLTLCGVDTSE